MAEPAPFGFVELRGPQLLGVDLGFGREEPLRELERAHLHREEQHGAPLDRGDTPGEAERERGLAHRRPSREHDEGRRLEPHQEVVDVEESGANPDDVVGAFVARFELVERFLEGIRDAGHRFRDATFRDLEHQRLGPVERDGHFVGVVVPHLRDLARDRDESSEQRELADDLRVVRRVRRRGGRGLQPEQRLASAERVEKVGATQLVRDRDRVDGFALPVERHDRVVDVSVRGLVEVGRLDACFGGRADRVARQQHRPEQRFLGVEIVGGNPADVSTPRRFQCLNHCCVPFPPRRTHRTPLRTGERRSIGARACESIVRFPCE